MLKLKLDYFYGDNIVYKTFSIHDCVFKEKLFLFADRNLTDDLFFNGKKVRQAF